VTQVSIFGKVVKLVVNVAALPIEAAKDIVTLGGISTEQRKPYTVQRIEKLVDDAD
jgi:hypothetical protein